MRSLSRVSHPVLGEVGHVCKVLGFATLFAIAIAYDVALVERMLGYQMNDFGKFYYSTVFSLQGGDLYAPSPATLLPVSDSEWRQFYNMNPPHFHLLLLPISFWGPVAALAGWTVASILSLAAAVVIVLKSVGPFRLSLWSTTVLLLYSVAWVGTGSLIVTAQVSWLFLGPLAAAWWAMRQGRWRRAGVLIGLLASVKPFLALLLVYLVVRRQFRALIASVLAAALPFLGGMMIFGYPAYISWIRSLGRMDWSWAAMNGSLFGFLARLLSSSPAFTPLVSAGGVVHPFAALVSALGIAITVVSLVRWPANVDRAFALLLVAALLFSPLGWVYYYWFIAPPLVALAKSGLMQRQPVLSGIVAAASLWPVPLTLLGQPSPLATLTVGSLYFWGNLSLWTLLLRTGGPPDSVLEVPQEVLP